jgi:hypothetical protein
VGSVHLGNVGIKEESIMRHRRGGFISAALLVALGAGSPTHADIVCKDNTSGTMAVRTGPNCNAGETKLPIQFLNNNTIVQVTGANLQVVSGAGSTGAAVNGFGNVIVGYNENTTGHSRAGSHNVVVGAEHGYASFSGIVSGESNQVTDEAAAAIGGQSNTASGEYATVTGGQNNTASGNYSSVGGGDANEASGKWSSVSNGLQNLAGGIFSWVGTGFGNSSVGAYASITGGYQNSAPPAGVYASITGGTNNTGEGSFSTIVGGSYNQTARTQGGRVVLNATIGGGSYNVAGYSNSTVGGSCSQSTTAECQLVP